MDAMTARFFKKNVLPHAEIVELFQRFNAGDMSARTVLIEHNMRLVASIAKMFRRGNVSFDDLIQEGSIGLMRAIDKFDWKLGYRFSTYASFWIRQAIQQHVEKNGRLVRLPAHAIGVQCKISNARAEYRRLMGADPTIDELVDLLGASRKVIEATIDSTRRVVSITQRSSSSDEFTRGCVDIDKLEDEEPSPFDRLDRAQTIMMVKAVFDKLPPREASIVRLRFGISADDDDHESFPITDDELQMLDDRFDDSHGDD